MLFSVPRSFFRSSLAAALLLGAAVAQAEPARLDDGTEPAASAAYRAALAQWQPELDAFAAADRAQPPAADGVLFVGSSTIRMWRSVAQDFHELPVVINRGFGGSTMTDCALFAQDLVARYRPRHVLVYAGDNDLAEGHTPLQVLHDFARFARTVREALPGARISFISIKPSPSREALLPQIREANHMVAAYLRTQANTDYIDVFTPMMAADGRPRGELFRADRLHMNAAGYRLWQGVIAPHVPAGGAPPTAAMHR